MRPVRAPPLTHPDGGGAHHPDVRYHLPGIDPLYPQLGGSGRGLVGVTRSPSVTTRRGAEPGASMVGVFSESATCVRRLTGQRCPQADVSSSRHRGRRRFVRSLNSMVMEAMEDLRLSSKIGARHPLRVGAKPVRSGCDRSAGDLPERRVRVGGAVRVSGSACRCHACDFGGGAGSDRRCSTADDGPSSHGPGRRRIALPAVPDRDLRHRPGPGCRHRRRCPAGHRCRPVGRQLGRDLYGLG